jgi:outer membrane protein OmpA-like peptidoglycan-associated protein
MNPINWWHRQEGGKIAQDRPAPPGVDAPYPNLSTVPGKPAPPDQEAMKKLTDSLIADRTNAQHAAQAAPLADPSSPSASPSLFGVGTAPPPPPAVTTTQPPPGGAPAAPGASASMPAVSAPPAPATPPTPAPRKPVQSAPLADAAPPPADTAATQPAPSQSAPPQPAPAAPAAPTAQPTLPPAPPPRPEIAGSPPPPAPTTAAPMPAAGSAGASIVFVAGSSQLLQPAADEVKAFADKRGNAVISVTGYGDATSADPAAQAQAVTLGLARAQAIFTALRTDGVPAEAIRVNAEASGRGAALHLLQ